MWKCNTAVAAGSNNSDTAVAAGSNSSNTAVAAGSNSSITAVAAVGANFQLVPGSRFYCSLRYKSVRSSGIFRLRATCSLRMEDTAAIQTEYLSPNVMYLN